MTAGPTRRAGVSLLETLVVLTVTGVLLSVGAFSLLRYRESVSLQDARLLLAGTIRQTASVATRDNVAYRLAFPSVEPPVLSAAPLTDPARVRTVTLPTRVDLDLVEWQLGGAWAVMPVRTVTFDARGRPLLSAPVRFTLRLGDRVATVRLLPSGKLVMP